MTDRTSEYDALEALLADPVAHYRFLVEESSDVLAIHEPGGRLRWISPSIERMLGWTPEERLTGDQSLIHPEDLAAVLAVNRALLEGADEGSARIRLQHKDGRWIWALSTARAWRDDDGAIVALAIVTHDIDDVVRAEDERRDIEQLYRLLAENAGDVVLETVDGIIRWVSPSVTVVLGWKPDQLVGQPAWEYMHPDDVQPVQADAERVHTGRSVTGRARARGADGSYRWFARTQRPVRDAEGSVVSHVTGLRDVHEQVLAEIALRESEEYFRLMAESASHFTVRVDAQGRVVWASPSVRAVLGWTPEELLGTTGTDYLHPDQQALAPPARSRLRDGQVLAGRARFRRADGSYLWVSQVVTPLFDDGGVYTGSVSGFQDVEAEVRAEQALAASEERFRRALASAPAGMAVAGLDRRLVMVNAALCRLLERDEEWLLEHTTLDVLHPDDLETALALRARIDAGEDPEPSEVRVVTGSGRTVWVQLGAGLLRDEEGAPSGIVLQLVDITEARTARERLRDLAEHDQLTGALHRVPLEDALERLLVRPGRAGRSPGVLYVDVDGLGTLNNTFGHPAGDQLLATVAARMKEALRVDDLLARFGGDEFVIVLPGTGSREDARHVAEKVREAVCESLDLEGHAIEPSISIGVAVARDGDTVKRLVKRADQALLVAKAGGKNRTADDADL